MAARFHVQVRDKKGNLVVGLKSQNFQVVEDQQPPAIVFFESDQAPATVAVLVEFAAAPTLLEDVPDGTYLLVKSWGRRTTALVAFTTIDHRGGLHPKHGQVLTGIARMNMTYAAASSRPRASAPWSAGWPTSPAKGIVLLASADRAGGRTTMGCSGNSRAPRADLPRLHRPIRRYRAGTIPCPETPTPSSSRPTTGCEPAESLGGRVLPRFPTEFRKTFELVRLYLKTQYLLAYSPPDPGDHQRKRSLKITAQADLDGDGKPEALETIHVREYVLGGQTKGE